jgi:hypothetical protein
MVIISGLPGSKVVGDGGSGGGVGGRGDSEKEGGNLQHCCLVLAAKVGDVDTQIRIQIHSILIG